LTNILSILVVILSFWNRQIVIRNCHLILREIRKKFWNDNTFVDLIIFLVIFCVLYTSQEIDTSQFLSVLYVDKFQQNIMTKWMKKAPDHVPTPSRTCPNPWNKMSSQMACQRHYNWQKNSSKLRAKWQYTKTHL
jgi:hypothetical protein